MKIKSLLMTAAVLLMGPLTGQAKLKVVTSVPSLASITEMVGGDLVQVESITRGVQDTHFVEAKPSYMVMLNRADLLIYNGMELEMGWLPLLIRGARNQKIAPGSPGHLNASLALLEEDILERVRGEVDRTMGDVHPLGNPHWLLNPHHGLKAGKLIAAKLIELDHKNRETYERNLEKFERELTNRIADWETRAKPLRGLEVVCYHPHWSYLVGWLGMVNAGFIELRPGIPPAPRHQMEIINLMQQKNIKLAIISSWKEPSRARVVADQAGAELLVLPGEVQALPGTDDYFAWIEYMVAKLIEAAG